ncbi:Ig-like domain-containing protein [Rhizobium alvei]|uniref:Ig-like domain-containing protein n=1 Tax=Rhizobium alvei TaxID=1132659 RepID=A0ABT8YMV5_9HYPH|nr:Ig-like domain-containing protein [Rhizobium alvei]MDO6964582.1 Ig-like domain-containing protein [Rhizobium alvei]
MTNSAAVVGGDLTGNVKEDEIVTASGQLTIDDVDGEREFKPLVNVQMTYGVLSLTKDGAWTYQMNTVDSMPDGWNYDDKIAVETLDGTFTWLTINVKGTNDAPTFTTGQALAGTVVEEGIVTPTVLAADVDDAVSLLSFTFSAEHGTAVSLSGGQFQYTAATDFYGTDTVTVTVTDQSGASATTTYSVIVSNEWDAPFGSDKTVTIAEDSSHTLAVDDFGFSDSKDAGSQVNQFDAAIISAVSGDGELWLGDVELDLSGGPVTVSKADIEAGKLVWKPSSNATGEAHITFNVKDDADPLVQENTTSADANTLTINVTAVNDAPKLTSANADAEIRAGESLSLKIGDTHFTDVEGDDLAYAIKVNGKTMPSWMTFNTATGALKVKPGSQNVGDYEITVTASDGTAKARDTFELTVLYPATSGDSIALSNRAIAENSKAGAVIGALSGKDGDGHDFASFELGNNPDKMFRIVDGDLVVNKGAKFDFETKSTYAVKILATDDDGITVHRTFTITVKDVREDPNGTTGNDILFGDAKNNLVDGGLGNDKLTGGEGADTFVFGKAYGKDVILDFHRKEGDIIDLSDAAGIDNYRDLVAHHASEVGDTVRITAGDGSVLIINHMDLDELTKGMFQF